MITYIYLYSNSFNFPTLFFSYFFFFNDTATPEIYTLSLHDALPISDARLIEGLLAVGHHIHGVGLLTKALGQHLRSEEHTSELQSQFHLVCRLLLEKKKKNRSPIQLHIQKNKIKQ